MRDRTMNTLFELELIKENAWLDGASKVKVGDIPLDIDGISYLVCIVGNKPRMFEKERIEEARNGGWYKTVESATATP